MYLTYFQSLQWLIANSVIIMGDKGPFVVESWAPCPPPPDGASVLLELFDSSSVAWAYWLDFVVNIVNIAVVNIYQCAGLMNHVTVGFIHFFLGPIISYHQAGFLLESLEDLDKQLNAHGSRLYVAEGCPLELLKFLKKDSGLKHLFFEQVSILFWLCCILFSSFFTLSFWKFMCA